jgi:hypothetical protein
LGELYKRFKNEYKLPSNYLELIKNCKYFNFYYNEIERNNYLNIWQNRLTSEFTPYTDNEYKFYMNLCLENQYINDIDIDHYIDNGCFCIYCSERRKEMYFKAKAGEKKFEKIIHREVIVEVKNEKIKKISKKINNYIGQQSKFQANQFKINVL